MARQSYVYILTNKTNRVLYTGVTSDLVRRVWQHKEGLCAGFTKTYRVTKLVYYEVFSDIRDAITREKQIKKGPRRRKIDLVNSMNPEWRDLYEDIV
jgi:putative endonuclease